MQAWIWGLGLASVGDKKMPDEAIGEESDTSKVDENALITYAVISTLG
jgi:hypothetical protein